MVTRSPWIGVGPEFDSQGSITLFLKYFFPNMHRFHDKGSEVEIPLFQHLALILKLIGTYELRNRDPIGTQHFMK